MIKCIVFDSDGTLVDSEYLGHVTMESMLGEQGVAESAAEMMSNFRGAQLAKIVESLEQKHQIYLGESFIFSYRRALEKLFEQKLKPVEGVSEALENIPQSICVASGGPVSKIKKALSLTNLEGYFKGNIFSSYEIGSWKPEPDIFLHAAQQMGFAPEECAVVEDSAVGIQAALAANMQPVIYDPLNIYGTYEGVIAIKHMEELKLIFGQGENE